MLENIQHIFLFYLIITLQTSRVIPYACISLFGDKVDWFVAYKLPDSSSSKDPNVSNGTAFLYADSRSTSWILSNISVADRKSAVGMTITQVFQAKRDKETFFALYNDENPNTGKTDGNRGHMKGVVVSDDINGFWLVHSVPKFPSTTGTGYAYPETGKKNGQSLLCITFSSDALKEIGQQLFVSQPNFYDVQLPPSFERLFPDLASAVNKKAYPKGKPPSSTLTLQSLARTTFTTFFKHKRYDNDLYSKLIAPQLHTSLFVETWMLGGGNLPSDCQTNNKIHNINSIRLTQTSSIIAFKSTSDHSKWAVSAQRDNWICIGDINHQQSQAHRGGGTVCMENPKIAALYRNAIDDVECCPNETACRPN